MTAARRPLALLCLSLVAAACVGTPRPTVVRRIDGRAVEGAFFSPYAYEHFLRGELAFAAGDWATAAAAFREARGGGRDDPFLLARLAESLDRAGDPDRARAVLATGAAAFPGSPYLAVAEGRLAERAGDLDGALAAYHDAARHRDPSGEATLALAGLLERTGRGGRAEAVLAALARESDEVTSPAPWRARLALAVARGDAEAADGAVRGLLRVAPARRTEVRAAARTALDAGDPGLALRLLEPVPTEADDVELRLSALTRLDRLEEAEALLARPAAALDADPLRRAGWALAAGRPDVAAELAGALVETEGGAAARRLRGRARIALGDLTGGALDVTAAPPGASADRDAVLALARALVEAGRPALGADVLSTLDPPGGDPLVAAARARALAAAGAWPDAAVAWRALGSSLAAHGGEARHDVDPVDAALARAAAARASGGPGAAARRLAAVVRWAPTDPLVGAALADALHATGRHAEARAAARRGLAFARSPAVRRRLADLAGADVPDAGPHDADGRDAASDPAGPAAAPAQ